MGATGWHYVVPYQPEMDQVLEGLRRDVFARGDYEPPGVEPDFLDEIGFFDADDDARDAMFAEFGLEPLRWAVDRFGLDGLRPWMAPHAAVGAPRPTSIEELEALRCLSMSGTHSILDVAGISPEPMPGAISPLPESEVRARFGTDRPSREDLDRRAGMDPPPGATATEREQGFYYTLFEAGQPVAIAIEGSSGD